MDKAIQGDARFGGDREARAAGVSAAKTQLILPQVTQAPLFSVIIANRNYEAYVGQAIRSVAGQTYQNLECVVVDDCSTDRSLEKIEACLASLDDPRFRCIRLVENRGQLGAMKEGLANTSGEFVAFLDSDDFWLPEFLAVHLAAHLNSSFSSGVSASDTIQVDERGTVLETTHHSLAKIRTDRPDAPAKPVPPLSVPKVNNGFIEFDTATPPDVLYIDRMHDGWHYVATSAMVFRRAMLDLVMPRDTSQSRMYADYYLASLAHWIGGSLTIGRALSYFRRHRRNGSSHSPIIGGPHAPGSFSPAQKRMIDDAMARHIIDEVDRLSPVLGLDLCARVVRRVLGSRRLYRELPRSSALRLYLGRGSEWWFFLKYGVFYRIFSRR